MGVRASRESSPDKDSYIAYFEQNVRNYPIGRSALPARTGPRAQMRHGRSARPVRNLGYQGGGNTTST